MRARQLSRPWPAGLILLASLAAACGSGTDAAQPAATPLSVRRAPFESILLLTGELAAERAEVLSAPPTRFWNLQIRWLAEDGAAVGAGDRLVELDAAQVVEEAEAKRSARLEAIDELERITAEQRARLAEAELAEAQAATAMARARLDAELPAELVSARELSERRLALERSEAGLEKARRELAARRVAARSEVAVRELALARAEAELAEAERTLLRLTIVAPANGILVIADHPWEGRKLQPGDGVWPGFPLGSLPDLESLYVVAQLSDADEGRVRAGMPVRCYLDALAAESVAGRVRAVAPMARELDRRSQRRAFQVLVDLERVDRARMRPGMSVRAEVVIDSRASALVVPRAAVDLDAVPPTVATPAGTVAVELDVCAEQECVVRSGIDEGARVLPRPSGAGAS